LLRRLRLLLLRLLLLRLPLLFLDFLLLALLHFLLLLIVFAFHLLELLLLALLLLLLVLLVGFLLLEFLVLLDLLLLQLLALLVLLLAQVVCLLLLALLRLRIYRRTRIGRPVIEIVIVVRPVVRLRLRRLIRLIAWPVVIRLLLIVGLSLRRNVLLRRPIIRLRLWRLILLARTIAVLLSLCRRLILLARTVRVGLSLRRLVLLIRPRGHALALRRQLSLPRLLHDANTIPGLIVFADLRNRHGAASVRLHFLQLLIDWRDRRRRRRLGDDRPRHCLCRRANASGGGSTTQNAALLRRHCGGHRRNLRRSYFARINSNHVAANRLRRSKRSLRSSRHISAVLIVDICDVPLHVDSVVDVRYLRAIDDGGVIDVDTLNVTRRDAIGRAVDIARAERKPGHASAANANADAKTRAAHPRYERGCVHRANVSNSYDGRARRDGYPAPNTADDNPAAVVERSKAPRRIVNPGPAPRRDPDPVAIAIRLPANNGRVRKPDRAVFRHRTPTAIVV